MSRKNDGSISYTCPSRSGLNECAGSLLSSSFLSTSSSRSLEVILINFGLCFEEIDTIFGRHFLKIYA